MKELDDQMIGDRGEQLYDVMPATDWDSLYHIHNSNFRDEKATWIFRGDKFEADRDDLSKIPQWAFRSRLIDDFDRFGIEGDIPRRSIEKNLIRHFRRKAHLHTTDKAENWLECLALIQHYEGPTRMLDWTYSFFAAVYFALNRAKANKQGKVRAVVWALDSTWLAKENKEDDEVFIDKHFNKEKEMLEILRMDDRGQFENRVIHSFITQKLADAKTHHLWPPMVYAVNPYYLNERLSSQQGVLLCPSCIDRPWGTNLQEMLQKSQQKGDPKVHLRMIQIESAEVGVLKEFLKRLLEMNVNQASLFPDLDGLAKSLRTWMIMPYMQKRRNDEPESPS